MAVVVVFVGYGVRWSVDAVTRLFRPSGPMKKCRNDGIFEKRPTVNRTTNRPYRRPAPPRLVSSGVTPNAPRSFTVFFPTHPRLISIIFVAFFFLPINKSNSNRRVRVRFYCFYLPAAFRRGGEFSCLFVTKKEPNNVLKRLFCIFFGIGPPGKLPNFRRLHPLASRIAHGQYKRRKEPNTSASTIRPMGSNTPAQCTAVDRRKITGNLKTFATIIVLLLLL